MDETRLARLALFIDAENLVISTQKLGLPLNIKAVVDRAREEGTLSFAKAYADWTQHPLLGYVAHFHESVIELTQLSSIHTKNTADMQIVVDAMEMALSPGTPEIFMLVTGDRDFVPLVQKLKRYGKRVVGVGLQDTTSAALHTVCDAFLFYNNLIPPVDVVQASGSQASPAPREPVPEDLQEAFGVLLRAVIALERKGESPMGSNIRPLMQQLDPAFDLSRFPYMKFADFVDAAELAGYVSRGPNRGEHFTLKSPPRESRPLISQPISLLSKKAFESDNDALQVYREILAQARVPMIPWHNRQQLIGYLWERIEDYLREHPEGMSQQEMLNVLIDGAARNFLNLPREVLQKQLYTLSLGECFERGGQIARLDGYNQDLVVPRCSLDEALRRTSVTYVRKLRIDSPGIQLQRRALALLLFDKDGDDELYKIEEIIERASHWS